MAIEAFILQHQQSKETIAWIEKEKQLQREKIEQHKKEVAEAKKSEGLNAHTIVCRWYHEKHPHLSKTFFGVTSDFQQLLVLLECCFEEDNFTAEYLENATHMTNLHRILAWLMLVSTTVYTHTY
jgi:hypothetical protein